MKDEIIKAENAIASQDAYSEVRGYIIKAQHQAAQAINSAMVVA